MLERLNDATDRLNPPPTVTSFVPTCSSLPLRAYVSDMVAKLLAPLRVQKSVGVYASCVGTWGFDCEATGHPQIYSLQGRSAVLELENGERYELNEGDITLLPHGSAHRIYVPGSNRCVPLKFPIGNTRCDSFRQDVYRLDANGHFAEASLDLDGFKGDAANMTDLSVHLMCLEPESARALLRLLPPVIQVRGEKGQVPDWVLALAYVTCCEVGRKRQSSGAVFGRLSEIAFIETILTHFDQLQRDGIDADMLALEPAVAKVIESLHQSPEKHRTLQSMAREVGMSRASFAATFKSILGVGPMTYLRRLRLERSIEFLHSNMNVTEVATLSGYHSEEAYRRAFKRQYGVSPTAFSRR